jgi:hypothetical protein
VAGDLSVAAEAVDRAESRQGSLLAVSGVRAGQDHRWPALREARLDSPQPEEGRLRELKLLASNSRPASSTADRAAGVGVDFHPPARPLS